MQRSPRPHPRPHHQRSSPSMSSHAHHPPQHGPPPPGYPYPPPAHPSIGHPHPHYQHSPAPPHPQQPAPHLHHPVPPHQQQHGPPPSAVHSSSRAVAVVPPHPNGPPPAQPPPPAVHASHLPPAAAPSSRQGPPSVPVPVLHGGSANGNNLLQGPPPGQRPPQAGLTSESSTVAQILREGEGGLREELADRKPLNPILERLAKETEMTWVAAGSTAEAVGNVDRAAQCYEAALKHNPYCVEALGPVATLYRRKEDFRRAAEYFSRLLGIKQSDVSSGETWGALGHCYLMLDDLQKAYTSYQQAVNTMNTPKQEPKLWYGIGILYDRYGSLEHAEEAFSMVIKMDPEFEKANEIYFRLGIIYKQQQKHDTSLACFRYILRNPPPPLTEIDIWFQVGHVYEQMGECDLAKEAYERVLDDNPTHAKVLQQLGGLYCRPSASFYNPDQAVDILTKSLETDSQDAASWYLLGRAYMTMQNYSKAYESYQQAVYRDGKNPAFWCSIGVLYYAISQYRDSLDAYSRAIRINPYIPEVWYNLGALYESCNDQMSDAIDAYHRAAQLDDNNVHVQRRLNEIHQSQQTGRPLGRPPSPKDMSASAASWHFNQGIGGPPEQHFGGPGGPPGPIQLPGGGLSLAMTPVGSPGRTHSADGMHNGRPNTATMRPGSSGLHHGASAPYPGPPHERRLSGGHGALAPMDVERSPRSGRVTGGVSGASHHNLPHIGQVYDRRPSRGSSPAPNQGPPHPPNVRPDPPAVRRNAGPPAPEPPSRHSPKLNRGPGAPFVDDRAPHAQNHPHHHPPSQHAAPPGPHHNSYTQHPYPAHEESPAASRTGDRQAWRTGSPPERGGRSSPRGPAYAQQPSARDHPAGGYPPPVPQHQSPYDPRHQSPGPQHPRGAPTVPPSHSRFSMDQRMESPGPSGWAERGYSSHMPPGDERRPSSQNGPPNHHAPARWDPKHEGPSPHRQKQSQPQDPGNRRIGDEDERRPPSFQSSLPSQTLLTAQASRASPTPSAAASEVSTGGGTRKGRSKVKDEDYAPSSGSGKKRKASSKAPDGAPKEKKERKKPVSGKLRTKKASSNAADSSQLQGSPSPTGASQPATFGVSSSQPTNQVVPNQSGPSTLQNRRVDEDYDVEDDEEGASSLLHLAGQGTTMYQAPTRKPAQAVPERVPLAPLKRPSRASPLSTAGPNDNGAGSAPHSATSGPSPPAHGSGSGGVASGTGSLSNRVSQSPPEGMQSPDGARGGSKSAPNSTGRNPPLQDGTALNGHRRSRSRDRGLANGTLGVPKTSTSPRSHSKVESSGLSSASGSGPNDEPNGDDADSGPEGQAGDDAAVLKRTSVGRGRSSDRDSMSGADGVQLSPKGRSDGSVHAAEPGRNAADVEDDEEQEEDQMEE